MPIIKYKDNKLRNDNYKEYTCMILVFFITHSTVA